MFLVKCKSLYSDVSFHYLDIFQSGLAEIIVETMRELRRINVVGDIKEKKNHTTTSFCVPLSHSGYKILCELVMCSTISPLHYYVSNIINCYFQYEYI